MTQFVSIAKITRTHGVRGEVSAILFTDFPERFRGLRDVRLYSGKQSSWEEIENYRFHKGKIILKFRNRERPHEVEDLLGCELQIPERERVQLPEDTYFDSDLLKCRVIEGEVLLGEVVDLLKTGGGSVNLVIATVDGREIMVPLVRAFVRVVDVERHEILVELPPGLADLAVEGRSPSKGRRKDEGR